jgi:hypothetical protein
MNLPTNYKPQSTDVPAWAPIIKSYKLDEQLLKFTKYLLNLSK